MHDQAVPWRRAVAALAAVIVALTAVIVMYRADGLDAIDAAVPRATRWFVHQSSGQIVLADGFAGRALARLDAGTEGAVLELAQSPSGVVLVDRSQATVREVDTNRLRLGPPQGFALAARSGAAIGVSQAGLVGVDPDTAEAVVVPPGGEPVPFELGAAGAGDLTQIAPDGAIWTVASGRLVRKTSTNQQVHETGLTTARFTLVGNRPLLFDAGRRRVQFDGGDWFDVPTPVDPSEVVLQEPGPRAECGWVAANDDLWCIGRDGVVEEPSIDALDVDGADRLAVAGDAAALVRRAPADIVPLDLRAGRVVDRVSADVPPSGRLAVAVTADLIWVDQLDGGWVWAVTPWGMSAIEKDDESTPLLGESGQVLDEGRQGTATVRGDGGDVEIRREPDDNGIDDPPVAVDDPVTARTGAAVHVAVTANDYDPDGEAIVLVDVEEPSHGTAELSTGTTVTYQPDAGYVGFDDFDYTIVDGDGTEASATVRLELLPIDAPNQAPVGKPDASETGTDAAVIVDVLLNDVDPERDLLRIDSFTPPDVGGVVTEAVAPSGLPALRYEPPAGASGTASFTYRPVDVFGAVGEPVSVTVEIAQPTDENRAPVALPDAVRVRRGIPVTVPVLVNDRDPDGDRLHLSLDGAAPPGLRVDVQGNELVVTAQAGSADLIPFEYVVDDGLGHETAGSVLVAVISDIEPNRPPIANADATSAVAGSTQLVDVLLNDSDPDGDPLIIVDVEGGDPGSSISVQGDQIRYTAPSVGSDEEADLDRFAYTITDGHGHEATGEVTVRLLPEAIAAPPFAQDDSATTDVDQPVTLDVLRNDRDPSGEHLTLVGTPGCPGGGDATVTSDSRVTYTPPPGRSGVFSCTYEVTNSQGLRADATIVINVVEPEIVNEPPIVTSESVTVLVDRAIEIDVLANDRDPDGPHSELRVVSSTTPVFGTAVRDGNIIAYRAGPAPGTAAIMYQVGDAHGGVSTGQVVIRIREPDPVPPVATDDARTITGPGTPTVVDVLANDADPDGEVDDLRVVAAELVSGQDGDAIDVGARTITFVPHPETVGDLTAVYTIEDADGLTATASATLTVLEAPNRPPVANDDGGEVVNGGSITVPIAFNDSDPDGDPLTYEIISAPDPALGVARLVDRSLVFDAVPGTSGTAIVGYRVDDGEDTADAAVRITVLPCAVAPPEAPDVFLRTGYQQPIAIDLYAYARNGEIVDVGAPLGVASGVYTPPAGENGNVSFNYTVRNSCRIRATGLVVIDVNQDPIAAPYQARFGHVQPVTIPVTSLATDTEPLRIVGLEGAEPWITVVDEQRAIRVDPTGRWGEIQLVAIVADPGGLQARVPITLTIDNGVPVANPDEGFLGNGSVVIDVLLNDTDPDGDALSIREVPRTVDFENGPDGVITLTGDGRVRVEAPGASGAASFEYTVEDALGAVSAPARVSLRANRPPVADDMTLPIPSGRTVTVAADVSDPDPAAVLTVTLLDEQTGPFDVTVDGIQLTITANGGEGASRSVRYQVEDEFGATAEAWLHLQTLPATTTTTTAPTTTTTVPPPPTTTTTTNPPRPP